MAFLPITIAILLTLAPTTASAWDVGHFRDRMTDRQETYATVSSNGADLYVGCLNGQVFPRLNFSQPMGIGDIGVSYRFDNGAVVPRIAPLSQDGRSSWLWLMTGPQTAAKMRTAKRLRVSIGQRFYDFNLAQGARLPEIRCK